MESEVLSKYEQAVRIVARRTVVEIPLHDLRDMFGTWLADNGSPPHKLRRSSVTKTRPSSCSTTFAGRRTTTRCVGR